MNLDQVQRIPGAVFIYGLYSPADPLKKIRYVGKAVDLAARVYRHRNPSSNQSKAPVQKWIRSLQSQNLEVGFQLLEIAPDDLWEEAEKSWIKIIKSDPDAHALNFREGGEQGPLVNDSSNWIRVKLTDSEIVELRTLASQGIRFSDLAKRYKLRMSAIRSIAIGETHKDAGGPFIPDGDRDFNRDKRAKLNRATVVEIKKLLADPVNRREDLAKRFNIGRRQIDSIATGQNWADVKGPNAIKKSRNKLSSETVIEIKAWLEFGDHPGIIAEVFGVTPDMIRMIETGQRWSKVGPKLVPRERLRKLTEGQVVEIKKSLTSDNTLKQLAEKFGVHQATIRDIKTGRTWKNI